MSSANQRWSGRTVSARRRTSSATFAGAALRVARAPERLRAPVAVERAAARRHDVPREAPVRARPRGAVRRRVDEVPGGERQGVEVLEERPRRRAADGGRAVEAGSAGEREAARRRRGRRRGSRRPQRRELGHRVLRLAEDDGVGARREVRGRRGPSRPRRSRRRGSRARARRTPSRARPRGSASCTSSSGN